MRKNKIKIAAVWLLAVVCLLAAGCGAEQAQASPGLLKYQDMILNTDGQVIFGPVPEDQSLYIINNRVLYDSLGNSCYALQTENYFVTEPPAQLLPHENSRIREYESGQVVFLDYGLIEASVSGRAFRFYDCRGNLVHTVDIAVEAPGENYISFYFAPSGDLQKSVFLIDQRDDLGRYQLLDYAGNLLVEKQGLHDVTSVNVDLASEFISVQYSSAGSDFVDMYTLDGQPMPTAHEYFDFEKLVFGGLPPEERKLLYKARYTNEQGRRRYDVLDASGNVVIGNLIALDRGNWGIFPATQGWGNLINGWLDLRSDKPVWLTEEPEIYSQFQYDERVISAMQTEREYDYIYRIEFRYDYVSGRYLAPYFKGCNWNSSVCDVLDETGKVLLSNVALSELEYLGSDVFVVQRGFSRGLMNIDGEWIYKESIFNELED